MINLNAQYVGAFSPKDEGTIYKDCIHVTEEDLRRHLADSAKSHGNPMENPWKAHGNPWKSMEIHEHLVFVMICVCLKFVLWTKDMKQYETGFYFLINHMELGKEAESAGPYPLNM